MRARREGTFAAVSTRRVASVLALCLLAAGCAAERAATTAASSSAARSSATEEGARPAGTATTAEPNTTSPTSDAITTTSTLPAATTTSTIPLPPDVHDPACARVVQAGESLSAIADGIDDPTVTGSSLQAENAIVDADIVEVGDVLDVCPGNGLDDLTGVERLPAVPVALSNGVAAQQRKLNELFAGTGMPAVVVDGVSGPFTRQQLCAARMALNLPISRADMQPGGPEEQALMAAASISVPVTAAVSASRWILIDKTCQVMFAGEGTGVTFVFKTSTGEPGWETRNQDGVPLYRYNPALDNHGWHNSSKFPVADDNPLNGNMYKPIYFYRGQAIHGANNVPTNPASKGCARLRVENQEALVAWLGLGDITQEIYDDDRIGAIVTVQGEYAV